MLCGCIGVASSYLLRNIIETPDSHSASNKLSVQYSVHSLLDCSHLVQRTVPPLWVVGMWSAREKDQKQGRTMQGDCTFSFHVRKHIVTRAVIKMVCFLVDVIDKCLPTNSTNQTLASAHQQNLAIRDDHQVTSSRYVQQRGGRTCVLNMSWGHAWGQDNARTVHAQSSQM